MRRTRGSGEAGGTRQKLAERLARAVRIAKGDDRWTVAPEEVRRTFARESRAMGAATWSALARHPDGALLDVCGFEPMGRFVRGCFSLAFDEVAGIWEVDPNAAGPRPGCIGVHRSLDRRDPPVWYDEATGAPAAAGAT